ncbi:MAG: hypothetical protein ACO1NN_08865 [Sphingopyxis sp.]
MSINLGRSAETINRILNGLRSETAKIKGQAAQLFKKGFCGFRRYPNGKASASATAVDSRSADADLPEWARTTKSVSECAKCLFYQSDYCSDGRARDGVRKNCADTARIPLKSGLARSLMLA